MERVIRELWNGHIRPCEDCGKNNGEIKEIVSLLQRSGDEINAALDTDRQSMFRKYNERMELYLALLTEQAFCDGFYLGSKIIIETLHSGNE